MNKKLSTLSMFFINCLIGSVALGSSLSRAQVAALPFDRTNPIIVDNDGNIDTYTFEFVAALASKGTVNLVGIIGSALRGDGITHYQDFVDMARRSGLKHIPDASLGAPKEALLRPASGNIDDTVPFDTSGAQMIVDMANTVGTPSKPLVVIIGGPLTTMASAYLLASSIVNRVIPCVFEGPVDEMNMNGYNAAIDGWAAYIVLQKFANVFVAPIQAYPRVSKGRIIQELPDREIRRHMFAKEFAKNFLPGDIDADGVVVLPVIDPVVGRGHYITSTKKISFDGWVPSRYPNWFSNSYDFVPKLKDDANGDDIMTTGWDADIATDLWWKAMTASDAWNGPVRQQSPYSGSPQELHGKIQSEHFDYGGQGFAYNDSEFNSWRARELRTLESVDIENAGSGQAVSYLRDGEWIEHTVNAPTTGSYTITARVAANSSDGKIALEFRDPSTDSVIALTVETTVNSTGSYSTFQDVSLPSVSLQAGNYVLRARFSAPVYRFEAENLSFTTSSGDRIAVMNDNNASGGKWHKLNANAKWDYVQYTINVPKAGTYAVTMRFKEVEGAGAAGIWSGIEWRVWRVLKRLLKISSDSVQGVVNQHAPGNYIAWRTGYFHTKTFTSGGNKKFRVIAREKSANSNAYNLSIDYIELVEEGPFKLDYLEFRHVVR